MPRCEQERKHGVQVYVFWIPRGRSAEGYCWFMHRRGVRCAAYDSLSGVCFLTLDALFGLTEPQTVHWVRWTLQRISLP